MFWSFSSFAFSRDSRCFSCSARLPLRLLNALLVDSSSLRTSSLSLSVLSAKRRASVPVLLSLAFATEAAAVSAATFSSRAVTFSLSLALSSIRRILSSSAFCRRSISRFSSNRLFSLISFIAALAASTSALALASACSRAVLAASSSLCFSNASSWTLLASESLFAFASKSAFFVSSACFSSILRICSSLSSSFFFLFL
mmetsp:Transcript_6017/g.9350  ORF Transcript_6017/g.9350 Transcript_6017/m.9350 type:complete len:200 (-) Transcript_6017:218-817(-)